MFNSTDLGTLSWGAPPVNGLQLGFMPQLDFARTLSLAVQTNFN